MKPDAVPVNAGLVALSAWLRQIGRSDTTGWRWVRAGWLNPINIMGRQYLTTADIEQFLRRAENGEFRRLPTGAARRSFEARAAKQTQTEATNNLEAAI